MSSWSKQSCALCTSCQQQHPCVAACEAALITLLPPPQERFPQFAFETDFDGTSVDWTVDNSKAAWELGIRMRPLRETILDMAASMLQLGIAAPKLKR